MKNIQITVMLSLMLSSITFATKSLEEELMIIKQVYAESVFELDLTINVYTDANSTVPYETTRGKFAKQGEKYRSELSDLIIIQNESLSLVLNTDLDYLTIGDVSETEASPTGMLEFDQVKYMCDTFYLQQLSSRSAKIVFKLKDAAVFDGVEQLSMFYDTRTHFISRIVMQYGQERHLDDDPTKELVKPKMEIRYSNMRLSEDLDDSMFSTQPYINLVNGKVNLQPAYKAYNFSDQRKTRVK